MLYRLGALSRYAKHYEGKYEPYEFKPSMQQEDMIETSIDLLQRVVHSANLAAGWYHDKETKEPVKRNFGELVALVHSELSEALEGYRKDLMDDKLPHRPMVEVEFADAIIRIMDTAEYMGLDVGGAIIEKLAYNRNRADHKMENRAKDGGKKF